MVKHLPPVLLLAVLAIVPAACGARDRELPAPMPTWFAAGLDVPDLADARHAQGRRLDLIAEPRWFRALPRLLDGEDAERTSGGAECVNEAHQRLEAVDGDGVRLEARMAPLPPALEDLPLEVEGARLDLSALVDGPGGNLLLAIELHAGRKPIRRESEHRSTNVTPFLVGLFFDGRPVVRSRQGFLRTGGILRFEELVPAGGSRRWDLALSRESVQDLIGERRAGRLGIVIAFSERQHLPDPGPGAMPPFDELPLPFEHEPLILRSRVVLVDWAPR